MRSLRVVLCGFTTALACSSTASAGTVTLPNGPAEQFRDMLAVYQAAPGETNRLTALGCYSRPCRSDMEFTDESAPLTGDPFVNGAGCTPSGAGLLCHPVERVDAYLGNMDDEYTNTSSYAGGRVWAGSGNDVVRIYSDQQAEAYGEGGNDTVIAGSHGGGGFADGGTGHDIVTVTGYGPATGLGGPGNDWLHFRPEFGTAAADLAGGTGDDHIWLEYSARATAHGDDGADTLEVDPLDLSHWFSTFTMYGDAGPDILIGGPSRDVMDGGEGRDTILATGGGADEIACGGGRDVVHADPADSVAADCETVVVASV
jgi:hypothetical protein